MKDKALIHFRFELVRLGILESHFIANAHVAGQLPPKITSVHEIDPEDYDRLLQWAKSETAETPPEPDPF